MDHLDLVTAELLNIFQFIEVFVFYLFPKTFSIELESEHTR